MTYSRRGFFKSLLAAAVLSVAERVMPASLVKPKAGVLTANISNMAFFGFLPDPWPDPEWKGWRSQNVRCMECGKPAPNIYRFPDDLNERLSCPCCGVEWFHWSITEKYHGC